MTTTADVLAKCRNDYLLTGARERRVRLSGALDASSTAVTLSGDISGIQEGSKISVGLEDMYVWAANMTSGTLTVQRGDFGSTAAAHADQSIATVNSRFSDAAILRAINDELSSLSSPTSGLFRMRHADLTFNAAIEGYDLIGATDVLSVYELRYKALGPSVDWPLIPVSLWDYQRELSNSDFTSGHAVFIRGYVDPGRTVRVWYRSPFTALTTVTDDVLAVAGLHVEAHRILAVGAAANLTAGREVRRNFDETQGDTRRAAEVPPGANTGAWRNLQGLREQWVAAERGRLARVYPVRAR